MKKSGLYITIITISIIVSGLLNPIFGQGKEGVSLFYKTYERDSLYDFNGEIKYYKFKEFPDLRFVKPQVGKWVGSLEEIGVTKENKKHVIVGFKNGQIKYIRIITDPSTYTKEFYTIIGDTIRTSTSGLIVSAPNYSLYIYRNKQLAEYILYMGCSSGEGRDIAGFCPYRKELIEYHKDTNIPEKVKTVYINKLAESEKGFIIKYDRSGKKISKEIAD